MSDKNLTEMVKTKCEFCQREIEVPKKIYHIVTNRQLGVNEKDDMLRKTYEEGTARFNGMICTVRKAFYCNEKMCTTAYVLRDTP